MSAMYFDLSNRNLTALMYAGGVLHMPPRAFEIIGERYADGVLQALGRSFCFSTIGRFVRKSCVSEFGCVTGWGWRALVTQLKIAYGIRLFNGHKRKNLIANYHSDICNSACV